MTAGQYVRQKLLGQPSISIFLFGWPNRTQMDVTTKTNISPTAFLEGLYIVFVLFHSMTRSACFGIPTLLDAQFGG